MSDSTKDRITTELHKAKATGGMRAVRIREILQTAASQTITEVREGSGEIRAIAKGAFSTVVEDLNENSSENNEKTAASPDSANATNSRPLIVTLLQTLKNRFWVNWRSQYADWKNQAVQLDIKLTERYGDRYVAAKQRVTNAAIWYNNTALQAEAQGATALEQKQAEFESKAGEMGTTVAKKEQQFRQQLKQLLQTAAAKL